MKRIYGPFLLLCVLLGTAWAGTRVADYGFRPHVDCAYQLTELEAPAADLLFVGSSRFGRAIDPAYIEHRLRARGLDLEVERLSLTGSGLAQTSVFLRNYTRARGFPRHVVLQLVYNRYPERQARVGVPPLSDRALAFGTVADLAEVYFGSVPNPGNDTFGARIGADHQSFIAALLQRFDLHFNSALRFIGTASTSRSPRCSPENIFRQSKLWPDGDVEGAEERTTPLPPGVIRTWKQRTQGYLPLDPYADIRRHENALFRQIVRHLQQGGARVYLTVIPGFHEREPDPGFHDQLTSSFPGVVPLDAFAVVRGRSDDFIAQIYHDPNHVNLLGARHFSGFLARELEDHL